MRSILFGKRISDSPTGVAFELGLHQSVVAERAEKQSVTQAQRGQLGTFGCTDNAWIVLLISLLREIFFNEMKRLTDLGRFAWPVWPGRRPWAGGGRSQPELFATLLVSLVGYGCVDGSGAGLWATGADSSIMFLCPRTGASVEVNTASLGGRVCTGFTNWGPRTSAKWGGPKQVIMDPLLPVIDLAKIGNNDPTIL